MRIAVADHISDTFLDTLVPLMLLVEAAQEGNQKEVEECAIVFTEGAAKLEEVDLFSFSLQLNELHIVFNNCIIFTKDLNFLLMTDCSLPMWNKIRFKIALVAP